MEINAYNKSIRIKALGKNPQKLKKFPIRQRREGPLDWL